MIADVLLRWLMAYLGLLAMVGFGLYGSLVLLPILLQTLLGYPALQAGIERARYMLQNAAELDVAQVGEQIQGLRALQPVGEVAELMPSLAQPDTAGSSRSSRPLTSTSS